MGPPAVVRVSPERAAENAELVRAVYAELAAIDAPGFRYATLALDDGVSFVHLAIEGGGEVPLPKLDSFRRFRAELEDRCEQRPSVRRAEVVGSFGFGEP